MNVRLLVLCVVFTSFTAQACSPECAICVNETCTSCIQGYVLNNETCELAPCAPNAIGIAPICLCEFTGYITQWNGTEWSNCSVVPCVENAEGAPDCRCTNLTGYVTEWNGTSWSNCLVADCPDNASGGPDCACNDRYFGSLTWDVVDAVWLGNCSVYPCAENATGAPDCICTSPGYITEWNSTYWTNCSVAPCAANAAGEPNCLCGQGYTNTSWNGTAWSDCELVPCPSNATGSPYNCTCAATYIGNITWDSAGQTWSGSCKGKACPPNADRVNDSCSCNQGYNGSIEWNENTLKWESYCEEVPCPANASGAPSECECDNGYWGPIQWNNVNRTWDGLCTKAPVAWVYMIGGVGLMIAYFVYTVTILVCVGTKIRQPGMVSLREPTALWGFLREALLLGQTILRVVMLGMKATEDICLIDSYWPAGSIVPNLYLIALSCCLTDRPSNARKGALILSVLSFVIFFYQEIDGSIPSLNTLVFIFQLFGLYTIVSVVIIDPKFQKADSYIPKIIFYISAVATLCQIIMLLIHSTYSGDKETCDFGNIPIVIAVAFEFIFELVFVIHPGVALSLDEAGYLGLASSSTPIWIYGPNLNIHRTVSTGIRFLLFFVFAVIVGYSWDSVLKTEKNNENWLVSPTDKGLFMAALLSANSSAMALFLLILSRFLYLADAISSKLFGPKYKYLPDNIDYHSLSGHIFVLCIIIHVSSHLGITASRNDERPDGYRDTNNMVNSWAGKTGIIMLILFGISYILKFKRPRAVESRRQRQWVWLHILPALIGLAFYMVHGTEKIFGFPAINGGFLFISSLALSLLYPLLQLYFPSTTVQFKTQDSVLVDSNEGKICIIKLQDPALVQLAQRKGGYLMISRNASEGGVSVPIIARDNYIELHMNVANDSLDEKSERKGRGVATFGIDDEDEIDGPSDFRNDSEVDKDESSSQPLGGSNYMATGPFQSQAQNLLSQVDLSATHLVLIISSDRAMYVLLNDIIRITRTGTRLRISIAYFASKTEYADRIKGELISHISTQSGARYNVSFLHNDAKNRGSSQYDKYYQYSNSFYALADEKEIDQETTNRFCQIVLHGTQGDASSEKALVLFSGAQARDLYMHYLSWLKAHEIPYQHGEETS